MAGGEVCLHGTSVAIDGKAVLLLGPSGAGKSGVCAQMIAMGAALVCDDLAVVRRRSDGLVVAAPDGAPSAMELRGFGIIFSPGAGPTSLRGAVLFEEETARSPLAERFAILGLDIPLVRHPRSPDLAAKVMIWLRSLK